LLLPDKPPPSLPTRPVAHADEGLSHTQWQALLRGVSRSFYLSLAVLPRAIRDPIAVAYLLARAADTLADTRVLPPSERLAVLRLFQAQLSGPFSRTALEAIQARLQGCLTHPDETRLLQHMAPLFARLERCSDADRQRIERVVTTLTSGMIYDLSKFPMEESGELRALQTSQELDHYAYMVAGCVGEFWTQISVAHIPALRRWNCEHYSQLGIRFGKGLQLTNILRDLPRDLRLGRCYLPLAVLREQGLTPGALLDRNNSGAAQPLLREGRRLAVAHLVAAGEYVTGIPRRCLRLRLAALWPLLIGLGTLERMAASRDWLDAKNVIKVDRRWVYKMMLFSLICCGSNGLIRCWLKKLAAHAVT
jgi:farnesyl-diphosphate farnesyltransferase